MNTGIILAIAFVVAMVLVLGKRKKHAATPPKRSGWHIGPVINGLNYSPGMPSRPTMQGQGWYFDFPTNPASHVHYVQWFSPPSLVGKSRITARFTVTGGDFVPQEYPDRQALVSLMFQRRGDNWSAVGPMESYRWFSAQTVALEAGGFTLSVPLAVEHWGGVMGGKDAAAFAAALADCENIAVLFGSAGGRGHGVYAKQPSRFTLTSLVVE